MKEERSLHQQIGTETVFVTHKRLSIGGTGSTHKTVLSTREGSVLKGHKSKTSEDFLMKLFTYTLGRLAHMSGVATNFYGEAPCCT